jgi:Domain of unknown function (DUF4132)
LRLFRPRPPDDEAAWAVHEARAGALVTRPARSQDYREAQAEEAAWRKALYANPDEVVGSALMLLIRSGTYLWWLNDTTKHSWTLTRPDAALVTRTWLALADQWGKADWGMKVIPVMWARATGGQPLTPAEDRLVRDTVASIDARQSLSRSDAQDARTRLLRLLTADDGRLDTAIIAPVDVWAGVAVPQLESLRPDVATVNATLRHLITATGSKPSKAWQAKTNAMMSQAAGRQTVRILLESGLAPSPTRFGERAGPRTAGLADRHADLLRAAAWAAASIDEEWVVPALAGLGARGIGLPGSWTLEWLNTSEKVPNACLFSLGAIASPAAIAKLVELASATRNNGFRKRIAEALRAAAARAGLTPGQLVERTVPTGGLDADGTATAAAGDVVARLTLEASLKVTVCWLSGEDWTAKPPLDLDPSDVSRVKRQSSELKAAVALERRRVEGLFAQDRSWDLLEWSRFYQDHPITGRLARQLIWRFDHHGTTTTGIPDTASVRTPDGDRPLPADGQVTLWHPATASTDEIEAWRRWLIDNRVVQPFKQAFREVYLLTPAEQATGTYSNRFAAHIVHYNQMFALFKERAWVSNYLGPYDGGYQGRGRLDFPDAGLTVAFEHFPAEEEHHPQRVELASTDRVWFYRTTDRGHAALSLEDVPPLVFSEAMRDVDLFVGVTSIALDPTWADRGDEPYFAYWSAFSFGELTETAKVRRDVLADILPKLKVADRLQLDDRHVRVRGNLASYKIHIGSGNILVEPDDRYLCIVASGTARTKTLMLPFEGDAVLSVVLSKAVMLAADDKIKDPNIVSQIKRRR